MRRFIIVRDWTHNDDIPPPRWLVYGMTAGAAVALVALGLMALWLAAMYLLPNHWLP